MDFVRGSRLPAVAITSPDNVALLVIRVSVIYKECMIRMSARNYMSYTHLALALSIVREATV